ncbi:hypothetical protein KVF89_22360 [Nocardioides carbamazepini]|uniref:hypothetical protein n=1 Tax=Nocardioides carbamazepini TaxID=2854259 RepID=UPI00214A3B4E|nr:hypothetical protein [Nocardioides carbamazepini]MCR1785300.1 hypothetical protein [Nocardioides carbamazepini]
MADTYERPTVSVPLFQGGDLQRIEELRAELMQAASSAVVGPRLLSETTPEISGDLQTKAEAHDAFVNEATERARKVTIQALRRGDKRELQDAHPPRMITKTVTGDDGTTRDIEVPHEDDHHGFNFETIADELVLASIRSAFDDDDAAEAFSDDLSDPHFNAILAAAVRLNWEADATIPKAEASLLVERIIAAISTSPDDSD